MSITDELRTGGIYRPTSNRRYFTEEELTAIADRIDAEAQDNERFRRDVEPFCDRLREAAAERAGVTMFGVDYVALPLDADGVPIHIGDKVTEHEDGHTFKVDGFMDWDGELWVFMRDGIQAPCSRCTHYHEPTVEDVLREFGIDWEHESDCEDRAALLKEYATKLQLKEDE